MDVSDFVSLFSFLKPSFADTAESFRESVRCDGSLSGRCIGVVVGRFLTVAGVLARELSLICKFEGKFNDNSEVFSDDFDGSCGEIGLIFLSKVLSFSFSCSSRNVVTPGKLSG